MSMHISLRSYGPRSGLRRTSCSGVRNQAAGINESFTKLVDNTGGKRDSPNRHSKPQSQSIVGDEPRKASEAAPPAPAPVAAAAGSAANGPAAAAAAAKPLPAIVYRGFSAEVLALAPEWRRTLITKDNWKPNGRTFGGESQTLGVTNGMRNDVAKPGKAVTMCYAAHEKIVSDLAFELDLPVPPGMLWDRADATATQHRWCYISAFAFDAPRKFQELGGRIPDGQRGYAREAASAMLVFDHWVGVEDRNDHNLIVDGDFKSTQPIACIDYAWSLSKRWTKGSYPRDIFQNYVSRLGGAMDTERKRMADRIAALGPNVIEEIVTRVTRGAADFLSAEKAEIIVAGLVDGQGAIHKALGL